MREIKFRAWNIKEKRMIYDVQNEYDGTDEDCFAQYLGQVANHGRHGVVGKYEVMQYTGLKDKNGKEIYEGDVVINKGRRYYIGWEGLAARFWFIRCSGVIGENRIQSSGSPSREELYWFDCEIIGNIYENPELLKNQKESNG